MGGSNELSEDRAIRRLVEGGAMEGSNELGTSGGGATGGKLGGSTPMGMLRGGGLAEVSYNSGSSFSKLTISSNSRSELSLARNSRIDVE